MPEKKKRTPKPTMTPEISAVIASIPFLNFTWKDQHRIANEEALLDVFRPMVRELLFNHDTIDQVKDRTRWADDFEPMNHVRETQIISSAIIRDLSKEAGPKSTPPQWLHEAETALDSLRVLVLLNPTKLVLEPRISKEDRHTWRVIAKAARTLLIKNILTSFHVGGAGTDYIGCCPRCGKIFEKPRADSVFCSKYCASEGTRKKYT